MDTISFKFSWARAVAMVVGAITMCYQASYAAAILEGQRMHPVEGKEGMVVTSHYLATESALAVLKEGGNAIDAAVAAAFSLAVSQPRSGNIGGGGFILISSEQKDTVVAIDYREKAPSKATTDMFLDDNGNARSKMSRYTHLAAGVPGTVAGLIMALDQYGTITLKELTSKKYAKFLRDKIDTKKATPSNTIAPGKPLPLESNETTHFSIVDKFGNAVANTYTINFSYGSGIVVEGAGFLLNNEMEL